ASPVWFTAQFKSLDIEISVNGPAEVISAVVAEALAETLGRMVTKSVAAATVTPATRLRRRPARGRAEVMMVMACLSFRPRTKQPAHPHSWSAWRRNVPGWIDGY